ncbi:MAG: hypothetical protein QF704_13870 [Anaerolineales bacterium]|jgi:hypothetical protein|nr:hypothetical protein [Anaerolineales bacterium]
MARIKFEKTSMDKAMSQVSGNIKQKGLITKVTTGPVTSQDIQPGEFVFTTITAGQLGPSDPTTTQSRIYFKDKDGTLFKFTGEKV